MGWLTEQTRERLPVMRNASFVFCSVVTGSVRQDICKIGTEKSYLYIYQRDNITCSGLLPCVYCSH